MKRPLLSLIAVWLVVGGALSPGMALPLTVSGRATWAENISRTSSPADRKNGSRYELGLGTAWHRQLSRNWQLRLAADASWVTEPAFTALDTLRGGGEVALLRKFGLGPMAPVLQLQTGWHDAAVRESGRSRFETSAGVLVSKRLDPMWQVAGGVDWTEHHARQDPFDVRNHRLHAEVAWDFLPPWRLRLGGSRQWGGFTANAAWPTWAKALTGDFGPEIGNYYNTLARAETSTYGPRWVAYRVEGRADAWWVEIAPAVSDHTSLPLRYEHVEMVNRANVRYVSEFWSLSLLHRF